METIATAFDLDDIHSSSILGHVIKNIYVSPFCENETPLREA
jgi:hypothetical protein